MGGERRLSPTQFYGDVIMSFAAIRIPGLEMIGILRRRKSVCNLPLRPKLPIERLSKGSESAAAL